MRPALRSGDRQLPVCRVAIQPSPRPVFIKEGRFEHLYIRTGNSTRPLTTKEAIDYCKGRWKTA
jgi:hypothetical protein